MDSRQSDGVLLIRRHFSSGSDAVALDVEREPFYTIILRNVSKRLEAEKKFDAHGRSRVLARGDQLAGGAERNPG